MSEPNEREILEELRTLNEFKKEEKEKREQKEDPHYWSKRAKRDHLWG